MLREDETNELKKTTGEINEAMVSISAILNKHNRGTVFFGLKNDGTVFPFEISDSTIRDVSRKIFESIRPQIFPEISLVEMEGCKIIKVDFSGNETPYSAFGRYYIRTADEDRELSPNELKRMMIQSEYEENWENLPSEETVSDVDLKTLNQFYLSATGCGRLPEMEREPDQLLSKLGLLSNGFLTNAGRYLFSAKKPLVLKMAVFATDHKTTFLDIVREEGNIFELIDAAMSYIRKNIRWKVSLGEDGLHRVETPEIPEDALREAVVNSFAHAKYKTGIQHEIDIFSNRISILNPGSFACSYEPEDFVTKDIHSYLRNEVIAKILYLCKDVETFGSGLRRIYDLCGKAGVGIAYQKDEMYFRFEFSRVDRNRVSPEEPEKNVFQKRENQMVNLMRANPGITKADLAEKTGKSVATISRDVDSLKKKGRIERIGSNKNGTWKVID